MKPDTTWTALMIGNSRLHWAEFAGNQLQRTWHTSHDASPNRTVRFTPEAATNLWVASVVPEQTDRWKQDYSAAHFLTLEQIPLGNLYPTFGIDRALAVWGASQRVGSPVLVIDAGTALTLTGVDGQHQLVGGAILPGLRLQMQSLYRSTAALPLVELEQEIPRRWATRTPEAIASGILHTLLAGLRDWIADWIRQFPHSPIVFTGGDGDRLFQALQKTTPASTNQLHLDPHLIFWGIQSIRHQGINPGEASGQKFL